MQSLSFNVNQYELAAYRAGYGNLAKAAFRLPDTAALAQITGMTCQRAQTVRAALGLAPTGLAPCHSPRILHEYGGKLWTTRDLAEFAGMTCEQLTNRLGRGVPLKEAVETPLRPQRKRDAGWKPRKSG